MPRRELEDRIARLAAPADAKLLLAELAGVTAEIGGRIVEVGRRILSFVFEMVKTFPNTAFGLIIGAVMAFLIGSVAFFGAVLGPLLGPILIALGLGMGAVMDMRNDALRLRIAELEREFAGAIRG